LHEALNIFAKHRKRALVDFSITKCEPYLTFVIRDSGQDFDAEKVPKGLRLESLKEKAELSGGAFQIESPIGQGTTIRAICNR
jgi:signal transduction histidine kinase